MKILIADDDRELLDLLSFAFTRAGLQVVQAADGEEALAQFQTHQPALVLLDAAMPKLDGLAVCQRLRALSSVPIIMLTVRNQEEEILRAFDLGVDDYVTKPFSPKQLVARVKAALRRSGATTTSALCVGDIRLEPERHAVRRGEGEPIRLTPLEYRLLYTLMSNRGKVSDVATLVENVWGHEGHVNDKELLKGLVCRVRQKIEEDPSQPTLIKTVAGVGYTFSEEI